MLKYDTENRKININYDSARFGLLVEIFIGIALFYGEPDLIDSLIHFFMSF